MRYHVVIPAAGSGRRFSAPVPKQYAALAGSTVIELALSCFEADEDCAGIAIALAADDEQWAAIESRRPRAVVRAPGGEQRAHSVLNALRALSPRVASTDWIMVHDAARPCFSAEDLALLKSELEGETAGGLLATPLADTLKRAQAGENASRVETTLDRERVWRAGTPQVFRHGPLTAALERALGAGLVPTDEAQAMEWAGHKPRLVAGRADNIKVTTPSDLLLASAILSMRPSLSARKS